MANSITAWMGDGLQGAPGGCEGSYDNPVISFGEPFGHAHTDDLTQLLENCTTCSIYGAKTSFNVSSLSTCHEVVFNYFQAVGDIDGRTYEIHYRVEKGGEETNYMTTQFVWDDVYTYVHGYNFFGWTPCFMWPGGSDWNPNYWEIYDNGTDYESFLELWDTVTNTKVAEWSQTFTITGLDHTVIYGDIKNYVDDTIDDVGIKIDYNLSTGTPCALGIGHSGDVYYRVKNSDGDYNIYIDGMEDSIDVEVYHSGYIISSLSTLVVEKNLNELNFTGTDYLQSSFQGIVHDVDNNPIENANVWSEQSGGVEAKYGCKTASDGKFALPLHTGGAYNIKAIKNNHDIVVQASGTFQYDVHPTSVTILDFTDSYAVLRTSTYPTGSYAHDNVLCVDDQSVIIPDDPVTGSGELIQPLSVGVTTVRAKTRKWGVGASLGTSTGSGSGYQQNGSGGYDGNGDMGDAENWEWEV